MNYRIAMTWMSAGLLGMTGCLDTTPDDEPTSQVGADGTLLAQPAPATPLDAELIAELELANHNVVRFQRLPDGGMLVRERGEPRTNAIGAVPALADASPYEIFTAIAPAGTTVPAALVVDQAQTVAMRAARGEAAHVPAGFRVDAVPGFFAPDVERAFNSCTDTVAWQDSGGSSSIGANCPGSGTFAYKQCLTNWLPPDVASCAGTGCTEYFLAGYHQARASVCVRAGTGGVEFAMGIRDHNGSFDTWFDHPSLGTGAYYYYWYSHSTQAKDFWRLIYGTGVRPINKSIWLKS